MKTPRLDTPIPGFEHLCLPPSAKTRLTFKQHRDGWRVLARQVRELIASRMLDVGYRPTVAKAYRGIRGSSQPEVQHDAVDGLAHILSCRPAAIPEFTRRWLHGVVREHYPNFRRSALRALIENALLPGHPIRHAGTDDARIQQVLHCLDVLESAACGAEAGHGVSESERPGDPAGSVRADAEDHCVAAAKSPALAHRGLGEPSKARAPRLAPADQPFPAPEESGGSFTCIHCGEEVNYDTAVPPARCYYCHTVQELQASGAVAVGHGEPAAGEEEPPAPATITNPEPVEATL
jgi:hypothetical protein